MKEKIKHFLGDWQIHKASVQWILACISSFRWWLAAVVLMSGVTSMFGIVFSVVVKNIVDNASLQPAAEQQLIFYGIMLLVYALLGGLFQYIGILFGEKISFSVRKKVYNAIMQANWQKISSIPVGDLTSRIGSDASQVANFVAGAVPGFFASVLQLTATVILVLTVSPTVVAAVFATGLVSTFLLLVMRKKLHPLQQQVRETEAEMHAYWNESCSGLMTIQSFDREALFRTHHDDLQDKHMQAIRHRARFNKGMGTVLDLLIDVSYMIVFVWAVLQLGRGEITYGTLSMLLTLQGYIQGPLSNIIGIMPKIVWATVAADRLNEVAGFHENDDEENKQAAAQLCSPVGVKIDKISFSYEEGKRKVFNDFSCCVEPGTFIAVMGKSGCGKTTLVRLIMSLIAPANGAITLFDEKGHVCPVGKAARKRIGYVPQVNTLFSGTILENVCFGMENPDEQVAWNALYLADAQDFIKELPDGLHTRIGEKSAGISEGQAQRIALARALAAKPALLLLDEATSALDMDTEIRILKRLEGMKNRPTILCVTHREAALRYVTRQIHISACN